MCDTLPPAPLSVRVRPSVWFGVGIRSQAHHDRHHQCLSLPAQAVLLSLKDCRALPRVTWMNLDCEVSTCLRMSKVVFRY